MSQNMNYNDCFVELPVIMFTEGYQTRLPDGAMSARSVIVQSKPYISYVSFAFEKILSVTKHSDNSMGIMLVGGINLSYRILVTYDDFMEAVETNSQGKGAYYKHFYPDETLLPESLKPKKEEPKPQTEVNPEDVEALLEEKRKAEEERKKLETFNQMKEALIGDDDK